jgi:hypothetical protein
MKIASFNNIAQLPMVTKTKDGEHCVLARR